MPRNNGLYLPDGSFMRFTEDPAQPTSLSQEIAVRSKTLDYWGLANLYLPNPDPILKSQGKDIRVYQDLMTDDRVAGSITNLINAVLALSWDIDQGKSKSRRAKAIKDIFARLPLTRISEQVIRGARGYGYCPTEMVMVRRDGLNVPVDLVPKPQRWFVFSQENQLRFLTRTNLLQGEELPARRFLCPTNEASYENPYGLGLLSRCFWPVTFKRGGWRFWIQFSEKFGQVWPIGKLPRSATQEQIDHFLEILERMIQDGCSVIPDDGSVDLKESGSKGATSDMYRGIIQEANSAISTVWLGHAGAGESQSGGKLGDDKLSIEVRKDVRDSAVRLMEEFYNQVIDYICEENWGSAEGAPRFTFIIEKEVDIKQAERDEKLAASMAASGWELTGEYWKRIYNLQDGDLKEKAPAAESSKPPTLPLAGPDKMFADSPSLDKGRDGEGLPDNTDYLAVRLEQEAQPYQEAWLAAALKEVDRAGNLVDLRQDLLDAKMDIGAMGKTIGDAIMLGRLLGMAEVQDEIAASETGATFAEVARMHELVAWGPWFEFSTPPIANRGSIISALRLPFKEAIAFFRDKVNIPTERWNDLFLDAHSRGFMIAGALKGELLSDLRDAVDQTISQGLTLREFRQQWDAIVERYGWTYKGGRNWRTRVVYETNTRQAYNAGRWEQVTDPDVLKTRPYLLYRHGDSVHPRPLHLAWNGTVLPADDPWWATHAPQNGWGCKCTVFSVGDRDLARMPNAKRRAPNDGTYEWTDKQGRTFTIPNGIDPGFQYNPGAAAKKSYSILEDRIKQLPPDIGKRIRAEIAAKS